MTSDAVLRRVRVLTLPSVLFASGLAGHAAAHGAIPNPSVLVPLFVLTVAVVAPFAGARTSAAPAVAFLAGGQALLHAAFQLLGGSAGTATTTPHPPRLEDEGTLRNGTSPRQRHADDTQLGELAKNGPDDLTQAGHESITREEFANNFDFVVGQIAGNAAGNVKFVEHNGFGFCHRAISGSWNE